MIPTPGPVKRVFNPARARVGHAWAYLPDLAEIMVRLLERPDAPGGFETFHFAGSWFADDRELAEALRDAAGRPRAHPALPVAAGARARTV